MIFPSKVIDVLGAGSTKSIDYSRGILQIAPIVLSKVIHVPIAGGTNSMDYSRDVLNNCVMCSPNDIDVPIALILAGDLANCTDFPIGGH